MRGRNALQAGPDLKEKHQPVSLPLIPVFANKTAQVQVRRREGNTRLFQSLTARAGIGRFPNVGLQFASGWTKEPPVGILSSTQQENVVPLVKAVQKRGNFVG